MKLGIVGGKISFDIEKCDFAVGPPCEDHEMVNELWIFDCILTGLILDRKKYISLPQKST